MPGEMREARVEAIPAPAASSGQDTAPGASLRRVRRRSDGTPEASAFDAVAAEVPVALAYNDVPFAVMMATPEDLADFALGFSLSEDIVAGPDELRIESIAAHLEGVSIALRIPERRAASLAGRRRNLEGRSGCGICGSDSIEAVLRPPPPVPAGRTLQMAALATALAGLQARQPLNALTGATHAAAFADPAGELRLAREDVGRHNALDKLIGAMARQGLAPESGFALVTSRASYEMVLKAARAGFPLLAAISAPTALAIALAEHAGLTLIGFARASGHVIYSHPHRLPAVFTDASPA
jgi:FdhD protein